MKADIPEQRKIDEARLQKAEKPSYDASDLPNDGEYTNNHLGWILGPRSCRTDLKKEKKRKAEHTKTLRFGQIYQGFKHLGCHPGEG